MKTTLLLLKIALLTLAAESVSRNPPGPGCFSCGEFAHPGPYTVVSRSGSTTVIPEGTGIHFYSVVEYQDVSEVSVHFALLDSSDVTLELADMSGETLMLIAEGVYGPGNYREVFSSEELSRGMYIIQLDALEGSAYTRIYLLR